MNNQTQTIHISGITCDACIKLITRKLSRVIGVNEVVTVTSEGIATINVQDVLPQQAFEEALSGTPYHI